MPDPILTSTFREVCVKEWGIRPAHALEAVRHPDQVEVIEVDDVQVRIVAKRTAPSAHSAWLLVVEGLKPSPHQVEFAIRAFANDDHDFDSLSPLQMLRKVVEICGARVRIVGVETPFLLHQRIPLGDQDLQILEIVDSRPDQYRGVLRFKIEDTPTRLAVVLLAFVVGVNRYKEYLQGRLR